ncbi:MAG: hydroxymethylbilane synthase [Nonlabens sp.]
MTSQYSKIHNSIDPIRIGTRDSELALWQARTVQEKLEALGLNTMLKPVKSQGDLNLTQPLYEMGITGIFTKTLDLALLNDEIDIAVHSLKDVPTQLPHGMIQAAVLQRASHIDILVHKPHFNPDDVSTIATGSLRRKAQWLHGNPHHEVVDLRGNVNSRLRKLLENETWDAAIFAKAGLERIGLLSKLKSIYGLEYTKLDSFIAAPAQGAMMVACMTNNGAVVEATARLNHRETQICVDLERQFLRYLEGGCTAPIGANAYIKDNRIHLTGSLTALDGKQHLVSYGHLSLDNLDSSAFAKAESEKILLKGGSQILEAIAQESK